MSKLTTAQKTRIGLFLVVVSALLALTVIVKLGDTLFAERDIYTVRVSDGVGGLQAGADVSYNGIVVGKVVDVSVDPVDVAVVLIELGLKEGTPVPEDAVATVVLQGISGSHRVNLSGGTNGARRRLPGEEIPAGESLMDEVVATVREVVAQMKELTQSISHLVNGQSARSIEATLANVEAASAELKGLLSEGRPRVSSILAEAEAAARGVNQTLTEFQETTRGVHTVVAQLAGTLETVDDTARTIDGLAKREVTALVQSAKGAIQSLESAVGRADEAIAQAQSQLRQVMSDVSDGARDVAGLAAMLKSDPSSLLQGRTWPPRELP